MYRQSSETVDEHEFGDAASRVHMVDASTFQRYDELKSEASLMVGVDERLTKVSTELAQAKIDLRKATEANEANEKDLKEQKDRIELVKDHWFYGTTALQPQLWFRGGVEGKAGRSGGKSGTGPQAQKAGGVERRAGRADRNRGHSGQTGETG